MNVNNILKNLELGVAVFKRAEFILVVTKRQNSNKRSQNMWNKRLLSPSVQNCEHGDGELPNKEVTTPCTSNITRLLPFPPKVLKRQPSLHTLLTAYSHQSKFLSVTTTPNHLGSRSRLVFLQTPAVDNI